MGFNYNIWVKASAGGLNAPRVSRAQSPITFIKSNMFIQPGKYTHYYNYDDINMEWLRYRK
jgi:hypothetical protein